MIILGTPMDGTFDDDMYHVEHVGIYAGYHDFGNGVMVPAVYSFNADTNRVNLRPYWDNNWVFCGWHYCISHTRLFADLVNVVVPACTAGRHVI